MPLDLSATATKLLKKLGSNNFAVIKVTPPAIDPDTGLPTGAPSEVSTTVYGALIEFDAPLINGTNIKTGDKRLLLEPSANYELGDVIDIYGERWTVVNDMTVNPWGKIQVYDLQVRKQ